MCILLISHLSISRVLTQRALLSHKKIITSIFITKIYGKLHGLNPRLDTERAGITMQVSIINCKRKFYINIVISNISNSVN